MSRIRQRVKINGQEHWVTGTTHQEVFDKYAELVLSGTTADSVPKSDQITFGPYLSEYIKTYKCNEGSNTAVNRDRIVRNHILPKFGSTPIDQINVMMIQNWLNELGKQYSHETLLKIKNTMSPALDSAVEDGIITKNPFKSKRITIGGSKTTSHKALPHDTFEQMKEQLHTLDEREHVLAALLCYSGLRIEEILGMRWEDIDNNWISISRAVIHPTRNKPEVKNTKSETSMRVIPLPDNLRDEIEPFRAKRGYLLWSKSDQTHETPLSYTEFRRSFDKIRKRFGITNYSTHDFRDTCATEWRENGIALDIVSRMLGHSDTEVTEKRYVKYRENILADVKGKM